MTKITSVYSEGGTLVTLSLSKNGSPVGGSRTLREFLALSAGQLAVNRPSRNEPRGGEGTPSTGPPGRFFVQAKSRSMGDRIQAGLARSRKGISSDSPLLE